MEIITDFKEINITENTINVNREKSSLINSSVNFNGKGNLLFVEDGVKLANSKITFNGNNSVLYLSENLYEYRINFSINNSTTVYVGKNNYFNGTLNVITSEGQNVIIGDDGLISFGIFIRTADPHLLYDIETKRRINPSKSVFIGDHVWIGQNAMILKGTNIGSGSVIGAGSVVAGNKIDSNSVFAGNPAKKVKSGIFFENPCVHQWNNEKTEENMSCNDEKHIYNENRQTIDLKKLDSKLRQAISAVDKLKTVEENIILNTSKDRFAIGENNISHKKFSFLHK